MQRDEKGFWIGLKRTIVSTHNKVEREIMTRKDALHTAARVIGNQGTLNLEISQEANKLARSRDKCSVFYPVCLVAMEYTYAAGPLLGWKLCQVLEDRPTVPGKTDSATDFQPINR